MVPAYDDSTVWEGHGSMITEISTQLKRKPQAIFCSVGGGGLLAGLMVGCQKSGWDDGKSRDFSPDDYSFTSSVPIIALETAGSNCFHYSTLLNQESHSEFSRVLPEYVKEVEGTQESIKLAHFNAFSSLASGSLGASQPAERVVKMALERSGGVKCVTVPDELSMHAAVSFARKPPARRCVIPRLT